MKEIEKKTEIDVFPFDWNVLSIGELAHVRRGASPRPIGDSKYFSEKGRGWIRIADVTASKKKLKKTKQYLSELGANKSVLVNPGDLIMSICATIGKPIILDMKACIHDGFVLFSKFHDSLTPEYFYYQLQRLEPRFIALGQEGTQKNLNTSLIRKTHIPVPPLLKQRKIAAILSAVDDAIEKTEAIIEETRQLKKGLMQKLFTEGIGHTRFKETKIGKIPEEWEVVKIGAITVTHGGSTPSTREQEYWDNGTILWATPTDITNLVSKFISDTERKITQNALESTSLRICKPGAVLMTSRATIAFPAITEKPITTNQGFINIHCSERILNLFIYYWIIQNRQYIKRFGQGSTFLELSKKDFRKFSIALPSKEEQQQIAQILYEVDTKIEKEQGSKAELGQLKKGLMQVLLTGKIKVKV